MNNKKKIAFLTLAMTMGMVLGACNPGTTPSNSNNPSSGSADTSSTVEPSTSSSSSSESKPSSSADTSKPSSSSSSSTSSPASSSSSSSSSVAPTAVSLSVNLENVKTAYTRGDKLDLTGIVVNATFSDGTSRAVHSYTTDPANGTVLDQVGEKEVVVTYKGVTTSFKVTVANKKFTVKFVVDGVEVQTGEVEEGQAASYTGETPTKAPDANAVKYRFKGWDKDLTQPITADTTFTAVFAEYAAEQVVDNFESYEGNSDIADAWIVEKYDQTSGWVDTTASVSIGSKATQGNKALRFDGWENGVGFRFTKHLAENALPKSANAIKFNMQIPSMNTVRVILRGKATIGGQQQEPSFTYEFKPTTNEYVEYTIPVAADEWQLWNQAGQSIKAVAGYTGIHEDDLTNYLTDVGFFVQGNDGANGLPYFAFVDNVRFVTLDEPVAKDAVETMGQYTTYTGLLNNGNTVKVELGANGAATATVIDMETPMEIPGNVAIDANKNMTFTSANAGATLVYKAQLKNGGQSMKFVEASGALAEAVTGVDLNAVQVVDNFDQYTESGQSYYKGNLDINNRSGARGAYYSEYYSGESHPDYESFGGDKWTLMGGSGNQLDLKTDGGHSGNNYLTLKNSKSFAMRYMQFGLFDGTSEQNNFRGSKLSFWAKTNGKVPAFKVAMYSQTKPRNATKDQYVKQETFTQTAAIAQWTHFEIDLNPEVTYYGFLVFMDHNDVADSALHIDDVEVYTANPYATYVPPVQQKELANGQVFFANIGGYASATLTIEANQSSVFNIPSSNMQISALYRMEGNQVTFNLGAYGEYVAELNQDASKLTYVSATGAAATFGQLNFDEVDVLDNAETYESSGQMYYQQMTNKDNRSGARGAYFCDYYSGGSGSPVGGSGWSLMGGNGDQLSLTEDEHHNGTQALKLKRNNGGNAMRYMTWGLMDGTAEGHTGADYFIYFVKNPNATAATIKTSVYYQASVTPSTQQSNRAYVEVSVPAETDWMPVVIPLDRTKTYYGVAYSVTGVKQSAADYLYVDDAMFYSEEMNVTAPFLSVKDLKMDGALANGAAASIKLGEGRNATLICEALGGSLPVTFTLVGTTMTITAPAINGGSGTTIVGTYGPAETEGNFQFVVTSCTGDMAAYLPANTTFTGSLA